MISKKRTAAQATAVAILCGDDGKRGMKIPAPPNFVRTPV